MVAVAGDFHAGASVFTALTAIGFVSRHLANARWMSALLIRLFHNQIPFLRYPLMHVEAQKKPPLWGGGGSEELFDVL
jgi:hypothetical protein